MKERITIWIEAFRLRTLPLAFSSPAIGSAMAFFHGQFRWGVFVLSTLTILLLQILSNLANDYGDVKKGTDSDERIGPQRGMQRGAILPGQMMKMMIVVGCLCFLFGIWLIYEGTRDSSFRYAFWILLLGLAAIASSIKYTVGKNAYGYRGLGDVFVFFWFGIIGVCGTYFLHSASLPPAILLPATSLGMLSAGVLNINNMRDRENDSKAGKRTLVVMMGPDIAKIYHCCLIVLPVLFTSIYIFMNYTSFTQWFFLITAPFFLFQLYQVMKIKQPKLLDPFLKRLAITTFFFSLTFSMGLILSAYV